MILSGAGAQFEEPVYRAASLMSETAFSTVAAEVNAAGGVAMRLTSFQSATTVADRRGMDGGGLEHCAATRRGVAGVDPQAAHRHN